MVSRFEERNPEARVNRKPSGPVHLELADALPGLVDPRSRGLELVRTQDDRGQGNVLTKPKSNTQAMISGNGSDIGI